MDRSLYKVRTGLGNFYVVATSWNVAAESVTKALNDADYGWSKDRNVKEIELVRTEHFFNEKRYFSGDDGINYFIIAE